VTAIDTAFKILQQGITDRQNKEEMAKIREALDQLEGGKPPEVLMLNQMEDEYPRGPKKFFKPIKKGS